MTTQQAMTRIEAIETRLLSHPRLVQADCAVIMELSSMARRGAVWAASIPVKRHDKHASR